jgi:hypothetical protein
MALNRLGFNPRLLASIILKGTHYYTGTSAVRRRFIPVVHLKGNTNTDNYQNYFSQGIEHICPEFVLPDKLLTDFSEKL